MSTPCIRGCTIHGSHTTGCTCTPECPEHATHCDGCTPTPADLGHLCRNCINRIVTDLEQIPDLVVHVAARTDGKLSPARSAGSDPARRIRRTGTPSPSPAWDTADDFIWWAHDLALACADAQKHAGPFKYLPSGLPARNLTNTIGYIRRHIAWYAVEMPGDTYDEITAARRNLVRLTGRDRLTHRLREPCPTCDQRTLTRDDGSDQVTCRNRDCGRIWREGEFDWLAHTAAG